MDRKEAVLRIKNHMEHHGIGKYPHLKLKEALDMAIAALSPPNEPLTIEQLREMEDPVWCVCKTVEGFEGFWCLCNHGYILTPARQIFDVKEIPHWVFYRRPPEGEERDADRG